MGPNQHKNWGVTFEWFDRLRGTRVPYVGTPKELADRKRNTERAAAAIEGRAEKPPHRASWREAVRAIRKTALKRVA
jgi:sterol desaturase/sphingolipid hydroxylase (fatty acid hydroxylase superfamily)